MVWVSGSSIYIEIVFFLLKKSVTVIFPCHTHGTLSSAMRTPPRFDKPHVNFHLNTTRLNGLIIFFLGPAYLITSWVTFLPSSVTTSRMSGFVNIMGGGHVSVRYLLKLYMYSYTVTPQYSNSLTTLKFSPLNNMKRLRI